MRAKTKTSNIVGGLTLFLILLLLGYIPFSSSRIATICESNSTLLDNATLTDFLAEEHNFFEKSVREGRYELLQAGVPFRDVMHGLPRDGTSLQANKKNVTKAIMDQVARLDQLAEQKDSTITIILWILTLQVSTFFIAVFHVLVVGRLLGGWFSPENIVFKRLPYWCRNIASHVATNATSILLTLGIGGTFLGLMIGLNESMAGSLSEFNIRALFLGLKISFVSTLAGIILSICVRLIQQAFVGPSETVESLVAAVKTLDDNIPDSMRRYCSNIDNTIEALSKYCSTIDEHKTTLDTSWEKARQVNHVAQSMEKTVENFSKIMDSRLFSEDQKTKKGDNSTRNQKKSSKNRRGKPSGKKSKGGRR